MYKFLHTYIQRGKIFLNNYFLLGTIHLGGLFEKFSRLFLLYRHLLLYIVNVTE